MMTRGHYWQPAKNVAFDALNNNIVYVFGIATKRLTNWLTPKIALILVTFGVTIYSLYNFKQIKEISEKKNVT